MKSTEEWVTHLKESGTGQKIVDEMTRKQLERSITGNKWQSWDMPCPNCDEYAWDIDGKDPDGVHEGNMIDYNGGTIEFELECPLCGCEVKWRSEVEFDPKLSGPEIIGFTPKSKTVPTT